MDNAVAHRVIIDNETGEEYIITPEKTDKAERVIYNIKHSLFDICVNLKTLRDDKLYLYAIRDDGETGYESFADFCVERLPWGVRQAQKYIAIADSFITKNPNRQLFEMPLTSLYELSQLPQETKDQMLESGTLVLATGEEIDIDALVKMKTTQLEKTLRAEKLKLSKLNTEHAELQEEYDTEVRHLKQEVKDRDQLINIPPEEQAFHKKITKQRESRAKVNEAIAQMNAAFMSLNQIEVTEHNNSIIADIEGFMVMTSKRLLDLEAEFGANLGYYKESMQNITQ